ALHQHRHEYAEAADGEQIEERVEEVEDQHVHVHAAPELGQAENGQPRQQDAAEVDHAGAQFAEQNLMVLERRNEQQLQRAAFLILGDAAAQVNRRHQKHGQVLHEQNRKDESLGEVRHFIG